MDKQQILDTLRFALGAGVVSDDEVRALLPQPDVAPDFAGPTVTTAAPSAPAAASPAARTAAPEVEAPQKLSATEVMFYIAGIVLFSAIMSMIAQSWDMHNTALHIMMSLGVGIGLWALAYNLHSRKETTDIRKGLENSTVLTGALCVITGGYITAMLLTGGYDASQLNYFVLALLLAILGSLHIAYDRLVRKDLIILLGIVLSVAAFPALLVAILKDAGLPLDFWSVISIATLLLLASATRVMARADPARRHLRRALDSLVAFLVLAVMYASSYDAYGIIWLVLLLGSILGVYYVSIIMHSKNLLGTASFFLVVAVLTISFKYFSGAGVSVSLIIAALGLLGTAGVAASINKKYFKTAAMPSPSDHTSLL